MAVGLEKKQPQPRADKMRSLLLDRDWLSEGEVFRKQSLSTEQEATNGSEEE